MATTHFIPAQPSEYGYIIVEPNDNGETTLERYLHCSGTPSRLQKVGQKIQDTDAAGLHNR